MMPLYILVSSSLVAGVRGRAVGDVGAVNGVVAVGVVAVWWSEGDDSVADSRRSDFKDCGWGRGGGSGGLFVCVVVLRLLVFGVEGRD